MGLYITIYSLVKEVIHFFELHKHYIILRAVHKDVSDVTYCVNSFCKNKFDTVSLWPQLPPSLYAEKTKPKTVLLSQEALRTRVSERLLTTARRLTVHCISIGQQSNFVFTVPILLEGTVDESCG